MQIRTYLGVLFGIVLVVEVSAVTLLNQELFFQPVQLPLGFSVPVYGTLILTFLLGFLPPMTFLVARSLNEDLAQRRARRRSRETESTERRRRRAIDFLRDGQLHRAAEELEAVLTEMPEDYSALLSYGEVLRGLGRHDDALETHRRASVLYPRSVALLYHVADDYEVSSQEDGPQVAREIRNRIVRDFPGFGLAVLRRLRDTAMAAGQWDEAVRRHDKIGALATDEARDEAVRQGLTYQRGVALLEEERAEAAAAIFRQILDEEPRFVPASIMLGEAELMGDQEAPALEAWQRGFKNTGSPVFLQRLEDYFIEIGEPTRAIEILHHLIAQTDIDLLLLFFLGRLYYRVEMLDEAHKVLQNIADDMDASPVFHYLMGRIRKRRDDPTGAAEHFQTGLQRTGLPEASYVCGQCGATYGDWQDSCRSCGTWNAVDLDVGQTRLPAEALGMVPVPHWGGYGPLDEDLDT